MSRNKNLHKAKNVKNDEFYTLHSDIQAECQLHSEHFKDKVVYLNCDDVTGSSVVQEKINKIIEEKNLDKNLLAINDVRTSNFFNVFIENFTEWGLKKLIATHYGYGKAGFKVEVNGDLNGDGIIDENDVEVFLLEETGDFRDNESIEILKEADIVVTNPPFSLFREYVDQLIKYDKKFLIIGSNNATKYKEIFKLIKNNKIWLGKNTVTKFEQPDKSIKDVFTYWFTNLEFDDRKAELNLTHEYDPEKYPKYDNYDAIIVSKVAEIPKDYYGVMGVPITFLAKHNPEQFEIVGMASGRKEFDIHPSKRYENCIQHNPDGTTTNGSKMNTSGTVVLKEPIQPGTRYYTASNSNDKLKVLYTHFFIKRKQKEGEE